MSNATGERRSRTHLSVLATDVMAMIDHFVLCEKAEYGGGAPASVTHSDSARVGVRDISIRSCEADIERKNFERGWKCF